MPESSPNADLRSILVKYAARVLSMRPYFRSKIKDKLFLKAEKLGFTDPAPTIRDILSDLEKSGYLNDQYLAEAYVRRQLSKGYGSRVISLKLQFLGLERSLIKAVLLSEAGEEAELASAKHYCGKYPRLDPRKLASKLYSRGYPGSIVRKVLQYNY